MSQVIQTAGAAPDPESARTINLRKEMLRLVLRDTLRRTGVPAQWIGGETTALADELGELSIEVRLIVETDEPRFLYYMAAFQAEFEACMLAMEPNAWDWVSRLSWSIRTDRRETDPDYEMPPPEYWEHVLRDRELTARQQGKLSWDQEALERHFENTAPGELNDFEDTKPPERAIEDTFRRPGDR